MSAHNPPADPGKAGAVLRALADLAPVGGHRDSGAIPLDWFRWVPGAGPAMFEQPAGQRLVQIPRDFGECLAALDQVRLVPHALRVGWLFVAGRVLDSEGQLRRVFQPLATVPVRVLRPPARWKPAELVAVGDMTLTDRVTDADLRRSLERRLDWGWARGAETDPADGSRLHEFALAVAEAAGLTARRVVAPTSTPEWFMRAAGLVVIEGAAVFAPDVIQPSNRAMCLREWADREPAPGTAFHTVYLGQPPPPESRPPGPAPESPFLLTAAQRAAVAASRSDPLSVVTGGPGTGKTHTVVAIACDALAAGESVLVAARSDAAVDALLDLFQRAPGPQPVVFGGAERRVALAGELAAGGPPSVDSATLMTTWRQLQGAVERRDARRHERITRVEAHLVGTGSFDQARARAPALFDGRVDLDSVDRLLDRAQVPARGWRDRWRARRAVRAARRLAGGPEGTTPTQLRQAAQAARALQVLRFEDVAPALESSGPYDDLLRCEDTVREWAAYWLAQVSRAEDRLDRDARTSVSVLATALRSGRGARREQLARLDSPLTRALPLWVGTLSDIEDLLPQAPALFDLVVLDEASSIDQTLAAPALLRGRRAVVVGDPLQLRQVSFLPDEQLAAVVERHGLTGDPLLVATIDVRRNSAFDVAAGAAKVRTLDEHFRCAPHLIDFVAQRIYGGAFTVATRSPRTERCDCIDVDFRAGTRDRRGAVMSEVERVIATVADLEAAGHRSVGVVTPFRAHADAIEEAALAAFTIDELERLDLRVGTVHAFAGNERDVIVLALGIGTAEAAGSWRFVEDRHLFAVMMTRARLRLIVLHSAMPPAGGLFSDYLAQADCPQGRPAPAGHLSAYAEGLAHELAIAGLDVARAYPTGRHVVDIAVRGDGKDTGGAPMAVICGIHRDGPVAHVDRHLALRRAGWEVVEALPEGWGARRSQLVVELVARLRAPAGLSGLGVS